MASLILGTASMASQLLSSPSSSLSFSRAYAFAGYSLFAVPISSPSNSGKSSAPSLIYCGRGDRKTAKGKRFNHSFGNARPKNKNKGRGPPKAPVPPSARKKDPFDDNEKVKIQIDE